MSISSQYDQLLDVVSRFRGSVAFSGGVDSSLVLKAAVDVFGPTMVAFFADSVLQPSGELENVRKIADFIGCNLRVISADPLSWPEFITNPSERCYLCKKRIYSIFLSSIRDPGHILMDGSNLDDLNDDRPGRKAIAELGVRTPLIEAGLGKEIIRQICRKLSLPTWNKISSSCLATRLPTGMNVTIERLSRVAKYESVMHDLGFYGCRARLVIGSADEVKLEIAKAELGKFGEASVREKVLKKLSQHGARKICLDLAGR